MSRVLAIGDTHCPAMHNRYPDFLYDIAQCWGVDRCVHIGDGVDNRAISFHAKEVGIHSIEEEIALADKQIAQLVSAIGTDLDYMIGNHSALPSRQASVVGLSKRHIAPMTSVYESWPATWRIHDRYEDLVIDGVIYRHGDKGLSNAYNAAYRNAEKECQSLVQGHLHAQAGVIWGANSHTAYFGAQTGCGTDPRSDYLNYAKIYSKRPVLGCVVVLDGEYPYFEWMDLDKYKRNEE